MPVKLGQAGDFESLFDRSVKNFRKERVRCGPFPFAWLKCGYGVGGSSSFLVFFEARSTWQAERQLAVLPASSSKIFMTKALISIVFREYMPDFSLSQAINSHRDHRDL